MNIYIYKQPTNHQPTNQPTNQPLQQKQKTFQLNIETKQEIMNKYFNPGSHAKSNTTQPTNQPTGQPFNERTNRRSINQPTLFFLPTTFMLMVSLSPTPESVDADCWNHSFPPSPLHLVAPGTRL